MKDAKQFPSPVRAMDSFHSLTPCASSSGTIVDMSHMNKIQGIDSQDMTFTAQAALQLVEASQFLRKVNLQFMLNIEIGNITLGSAACCQTKDALDCVEFGQVNSYVTRIKWVAPSGELGEASEEENPDLLYLVRSSYGMCGIVYEVMFKVKPLEAVEFNYLPYKIDDLAQEKVSTIIANNEAMVCWTVGRTTVIQTRNRKADFNLKYPWLAGVRRIGWSRAGASVGRKIQLIPNATLKNLIQDLWVKIQEFTYKLLNAIEVFSLYNPDKIINYAETPPDSRYAFTFWAFSRDQWVSNLKSYPEFSESHFKKHGFRCNMPLGSYYIKRDTSSILSYTHDGDIISIDPIHAYSDTDKSDWEYFLKEFRADSYCMYGIV
ncbi:MAG: FAD-binding protein [Ignavibacteriales bacterium]